MQVMALRIGQPRSCMTACVLLRHHRKQCKAIDLMRLCSTSSGQAKNANPASNAAPPPLCVPDKPAVKSAIPKTVTSGPRSHPETPPPPPKPKLSPMMMRQNVKGYVFTRYIDYVKNYDKVLEKNFPSAMKVYRVFFDGVKDFYADMKRYLKILRIVNESPKGIRALNRQELELYVQMRRDMVKVAPALIGSSLPMIGYAIFPIVFMYPRTFLTSHFWSLQQRSEFAQLKMQERLNHNRPIFRLLQAKLEKVSDHDKCAELSNLLGLMGSGFHPTVEAILYIKDFFNKPPFNLLSLSGKHVKLLVELHGLPMGLFKRYRLTEYAFLVHYMDRAIQREGGVHNMPIEALRNSCYIRGLNPTNLSNEEMIKWLRNWITLSTTLQEQHISLFLHLPLFLAYNHPNNWQLIYSKKS